MTTFGTALILFAVPGAYIVGLVVGVVIGRWERKHGVK